MISLKGMHKSAEMIDIVEHSSLEGQKIRSREELAKAFTGTETTYLDEEPEYYNFVGDHEIVSIPCVADKYGNIGCNLSQNYVSGAPGYYKESELRAPDTTDSSFVLTCREFAINLEPEEIDNIYLEIGASRVDDVYGPIIEPLCDIYDIPRKNESGYTILPFNLSKIGMEYLDFHSIKLYIRPVNKDPKSFKKLNIQVKLQYAEKKESREFIYFQTLHTTSCTYDKSVGRFNLVHPILYLLVEDDLDVLELSIHGRYTLKIERYKKYKDISVFALVDHIYDFKHYLNFSMIWDSRSNIVGEKNIYGIGCQVLRIMSGMAGMKYSK